MDAKSHLKGRLLGYEQLPEQSGRWGILLPRPREKVVAHEPNAQDVLRRLDDCCLVFDNSMSVGNRGFLLFISMFFFGILSFGVFANLFSVQRETEVHWSIFIVDAFLFLILPLSALYVAFKNARSLLPPPVYVNRTHRKIYAWSGSTKHWIALDYDEVVPATIAIKVVTPSGASTVYSLTLNQLERGSRAIEYSVSPAPARGHPEYCGAIWEYIRRYMDERPEALPAVRLAPALDQSTSAWMAHTDRTVFTDFIDDEHRVRRNFFAMAVVYFWGSIGYWWVRATGWIERTAPRPALPRELEEHLNAASAVGYKTIVPAEIPSGVRRLHRRWLVCGIMGSLVWGGLFGLVIAGIWVMR